MTVRFVIDGPASPREVRARLRVDEYGRIALQFQERGGEWWTIASVDGAGNVDTAWPAVKEGVVKAGRVSADIFPAFAEAAPEPQDAAPRQFEVGDRVKFGPRESRGVIVEIDRLHHNSFPCLVYENGATQWWEERFLTHADAAP